MRPYSAEVQDQDTSRPAELKKGTANISAHAGASSGNSTAGATDRLVQQVLVEAWEGTGALVLQLWTLHVMVQHNAGCTLAHTGTCLAGWPQEHMPPSFLLQAVFCVKWAWYLHNSLKHRWGLGLNEVSSSCRDRLAVLSHLLLLQMYWLN